jgi:hypothetical protein
MFTVNEVRTRLRQQPFQPFRFVTSSGQFYDLHHPDLVLLGQRDLHVGLSSRDDPSLYETVARLAIMHITAMEDLPVTPPALTETNGQNSQR